MADKKISALTGATTPLAGTEVLPVVQSGATVKVSVANLTAGRAIDTTSVNKVAITAPVTGATLTIAEGKTLTASNSLTFAGTDATTMTFPTTSATVARTDAANSFTGDQTLATGNLIVSDGKGIDFSATPGTGTSELLSDYEEGTWTGVVTGSTGAPTTPNATTGTYTKVGRQVTVSLPTSLIDLTGATGLLRVTGLPFEPTQVGLSTYFSFQLSLGGYPIAVVFAGASTIYFYYTVNNADWAEQPVRSAGGQILYLSLTYFA